MGTRPIITVGAVSVKALFVSQLEGGVGDIIEFERENMRIDHAKDGGDAKPISIEISSNAQDLNRDTDEHRAFGWYGLLYSPNPFESEKEVKQAVVEHITDALENMVIS